MIVADRYAKSLMDLAAEINKVEEVKNDMRMVEKIYDESRDFRLLLESPVIKTDKKLKTVQAIFGKDLSKTTLAFLDLMIRKHRESLVKEIAKSFNELYKHNKNIFTAVVTSANGLDKTTRQKMLDLLEKEMKGGIELVEKVDPKTIGGFMLRIGDKQVDKTVARQLSNMKKQLLKGKLN
jgi:F-type H+-transporting ATPase subunit delta